MAVPLMRCPSCTHDNLYVAPLCSTCGLKLTGPVAYEIRRLEGELAVVIRRIDEQRRIRAGYVQHLRTLVDRLRDETNADIRHAAVPAAPPPQRPTPQPRPVQPPKPQPRPSATKTEARAVDENSPWTVQNVLLVLGGLLLSVAAIVFTVVAWGRFGIGGRAAILGGLTAVVLGLPVLLDRKGLKTTAVTIGTVGLVFLGLDGYAARASHLVPDSLPGTTYAGLVLALVAGVAALYPMLVRNAFMRPLAIVLGQAVIPLLVAETHPTATGWAAAIGIVAAADIALGTKSLTAKICAAAAVVVSVSCALVGVVIAAGTWSALLAALVLVAGTGLATAAGIAFRLRWAASIGAGATAVAVAIGLVSVPMRLPTHPSVIMLTAIAALVVAAAAVSLPKRWRTGPMIGAAVPLAAAALPVALSALFVLVSHTLLRTPVVTDEQVATAALVVAAGSLLAWRAIGHWGAVAVVGACATALLMHLPWPVNLPLQLAVVGAAVAVPLVRKVRHEPVWVTSALVLLADIAAWSLQAQSSAVAALSAIAAGAVIVAWVARDRTVSWLPVVIAVAAAGGASIAILWDIPLWWMAFGPLAVAGLATGAAAVLKGRQRIAAEISALPWVLVAIGLTVAHPWQTGLVLALAAALAGAVAVRRDRRFAIVVAAVLGILASWSWLYAAGVHTPEAYTLPASLLVIAAGVARADLRPALGIGAVGALLPSLAMVPVEPDAGWIRLTAIAVASIVVAVFVRVKWVGSVGWLVFSAVVGVLAAAADVVAVGHRLGWEPRWTAVAVVGIVAVSVATAAFVRDKARSLAVELAAGVASLLAVALTIGEPWQGGLVFALLGAIAAGAAFRPDRRWLGYVAAALVVIASWHWLAAGDSQVPEAYVLPGALGLLVFRLVRREPSALDTAQIATAGIVAVLPSVLWLLVEPDNAWIRLTAWGAVAVAVAGGASLVKRPWAIPGVPVSGWWLMGEVAAGGAVLALGLDCLAVGYRLDAGWLTPAYAMLAVVAVAVGVSAAIRTVRPRLAVVLEFAAMPIVLNAVALTVGEPFHIGLALFLTGIIVALCALRPDRRWLAFAAIGLELVASWCWLVAARVATPEAYTVPAALLALAGGVLLSRRWPQLRSWVTFGPGITGLLAPSLVMTFLLPGEPWRPFALGVAALAVTLLGVYRRRQAPFTIGAMALAIVAVHELSPYVAAVVTDLPRWVPLAVGGLLLLAIGARYERRRQDVIRLGRAVARMR